MLWIVKNDFFYNIALHSWKYFFSPFAIIIISRILQLKLCTVIWYLLTKFCPLRGWKRRCSVGKLVGLTASPARPVSIGLVRFCCSERSIMIFLQMSRSVLAMVRAGMSHRNTWHMCLRVPRSRATYAKSLCHTSTLLNVTLGIMYMYAQTTGKNVQRCNRGGGG